MSTRIIFAAVLQYSHFFKVPMFMVCWLGMMGMLGGGWGFHPNTGTCNQPRSICKANKNMRIMRWCVSCFDVWLFLSDWYGCLQIILLVLWGSQSRHRCKSVFLFIYFFYHNCMYPLILMEKQLLVRFGCSGELWDLLVSYSIRSLARKILIHNIPYAAEVNSQPSLACREQKTFGMSSVFCSLSCGWVRDVHTCLLLAAWNYTLMFLV